MIILFRIADFVKLLEPLFGLEEFEQIGPVLYSVFGILNENFVSMQSANYTLDNAAQSIPAVRKLLQNVGLDLNNIIFTTIRNPQLLAEMLLSTNLKNDFCVKNRWHEVFQLPLDFNTSSLYSAFCLNDVEPLALSLENLVAGMKGNVTFTSTLPDYLVSLLNNLENLIKNPPSIDHSSFLIDIAERYNSTEQLWKILSSFSTLISNVDYNSYQSPLRDIFQIAGNVNSISNTLVKFLTDLLVRFELQNNQLNIASLFNDVPEVKALINNFFNLDLSTEIPVSLNPLKVSSCYLPFL